MDRNEQLRQAIICDNGNEVARLLTKYPNLISWHDAAHETPLHFAAFWDKKVAVKAIIDFAPNLTSATNFLNETPLHVAAYSGALGAMRVLLVANPSIALAKNDAGLTFLDTAQEFQSALDLFLESTPLTAAIYLIRKSQEESLEGSCRLV